MIVDAHLDLAYNALDLGRDLTLPLSELRQRKGEGEETPMVTLPALKEAGVGLAFATVFVDPKAHAGRLWEEARRQVALYRAWEERGLVRLLRDGEDLKRHLEAYPRDGVLGLVLLLEGAHPLPEPEALEDLYREGVRLLGPAWATGSPYAGGNAHPGPLTPMGEALLLKMEELGVALDLSHLADEAFFQALEHYEGPVLVSHANPRALAPTPRNLSDGMLLALRARGGVLGLVPFNAFLDAGWKRGMPRLPLARFLEHKAYAEGLLGREGVGLGSDWDGGFGLESVPLGLEGHGDLKRLGDEAFLGGNWLRWLSSWL
ncbi:Zn-dependent dipeptidase, microsomal dipeptidase [Thermus oshimai JL-2]|uniref:Zn-dependent dipeptidase, microsomal dipeptidase n=1 Tax=Thermus oshimai JL-2 TaxID=751945 RepID=K7QWI0_THEOS|nr:membrane dipeptidase [Thermus oshimai]AFV75858.1 Zn-dependent dipeptidase, microsomal dipeptidase [Thermus oshimai JL-2]